MLVLDHAMTERTHPFELFVGAGLLGEDRLRELTTTAPTSRVERIAVDDPAHEKQYRMNLVSLLEAENETAHVAALPPVWRSLLEDLRSRRFTAWLEKSTGIGLAGLERSIGIYAHRNGDFLSVHKDKPTKAITAILYVNEHWPEEAGGRFQCFATGEPGAPPVAEIHPEGGRLLAFKPTDSSWHAVSEVCHPRGLERLTVQIEYWVTTELMGSAYRPNA